MNYYRYYCKKTLEKTGDIDLSFKNGIKLCKHKERMAILYRLFGALLSLSIVGAIILITIEILVNNR